MTDKTAALVAEARQKMKPGLFGLFRKPDEAGELFEKAAGQYKLAKEWKDAAETYILAADAFKDANDSTKTKNMFVEAAKSYKKVSSADAIRVYKIAATMHSEANQLSSAAKIYKEIGEMYESDHDLKSAIEAFSQASELFAAEDQVTTGNQCRIQMANLSAMVEDYRRAIVIYEEVASASLDNKLLQWSAKGYYFQALLCHLALSVAGGLDISGPDDAVKQYKNMYPAFDGSRECKFCEQLLEAIAQGDMEKFEDALYEFDRISKLDSWKTGILLQIKKAMHKASSEVAEIDLT